MLRKIKQSLGLSLDKAGGYAIIKTKGHCYSSQALIVQSISIDDRFGYQPDGHRAFIQKMYSRMQEMNRKMDLRTQKVSRRKQQKVLMIPR